ncbi:MAG: hypothetical protein V8R55_12030 [Dysosmobacter sp.]
MEFFAVFTKKPQDHPDMDDPAEKCASNTQSKAASDRHKKRTF